ncbi:MAG: hypothetical protein AB7E31_11065 [Desulfitobacterium sp.]
MTWIAPLGILLSIILIIYLATKGYSILIIGPLCSVLVILTNQMDLFSALITGDNSYMMGLAKFIANFFVVFLLGSVLARYIEASGAAKSIAAFVLKIIGTESPYSMLVSLFLVCSLLTFGGVSLFVVIFAIIPLARPLFKQMNISWSLIAIPIEMGILTFTMTMLPGSPYTNDYSRHDFNGGTFAWDRWHSSYDCLWALVYEEGTTEVPSKR